MFEGVASADGIDNEQEVEDGKRSKVVRSMQSCVCFVRTTVDIRKCQVMLYNGVRDKSPMGRHNRRHTLAWWKAGGSPMG